MVIIYHMLETLIIGRTEKDRHLKSSTSVSVIHDFVRVTFVSYGREGNRRISKRLNTHKSHECIPHRHSPITTE